MPNYDGTGPDGKGPMTGRGRGYCVIPISTPKQELDFLTSQAQALQAQLKQIRTRIKEVKIRKEVHHARI
jgi:hypothetical protein